MPLRPRAAAPGALPPLFCCHCLQSAGKPATGGNCRNPRMTGGALEWQGERETGYNLLMLMLVLLSETEVGLAAVLMRASKKSQIPNNSIEILTSTLLACILFPGSSSAWGLVQTGVHLELDSGCTCLLAALPKAKAQGPGCDALRLRGRRPQSAPGQIKGCSCSSGWAAGWQQQQI